MIIPRGFYSGDPIAVARSLVGAYLCVDAKRARICELELYLENDRACHAHRGRTERNAPMFLAGGHAYVYLCYGLHNLFNVVIGDENTPRAVLIRALEATECNGPAKLTKVFGITREHNGLDLTVGKKLWLEPRSAEPKIAVGRRIGVDYAGPDAELPYRFGIKDSPFLSRPIRR